LARLKKQLIVVGDRILVRPEEGEERTRSGLYLPQTAISARMAQGGWVVAVGPGVPIPQDGDFALFLRKAAVEITFEKQQYLIVPNSAVLVLVREGWEDDSLEAGAEQQPTEEKEREEPE
jgi:chaperonin GroES